MSQFISGFHRRPERVEKARVKKPAQYARTAALAARMGNAVSADLVTGIRTFKEKIDPDQLKSAWKKGDYSRLMREIPWSDLPEDIDPAFKGVRSSWGEAAGMSLKRLPPNVNERLRFDVSNPNLEQYISERTGSLVVGIQADAQEAIQTAVRRSFLFGATPDDVADQIKDSIGLLPRQETALRNYARGLQAKGYPLSNVQAYSADYADRLLDQRATNIGRTEVRQATNFGQLSMWQEAASQGLINPASTRKTWVTDASPCPECAEMEGTSVALDDVWTMSDGTVCDVPSDAHPGCFCGMVLTYGEAEATTQEE